MASNGLRRSTRARTQIASYHENNLADAITGASAIVRSPQQRRSRRKATSAMKTADSIMPSETSSFQDESEGTTAYHLLALPPELRNYIYELVLSDPIQVPNIRERYHNRGPSEHFPLDGLTVVKLSGLLQSCKQIYNELHSLVIFEVVDAAQLIYCMHVLGSKRVSQIRRVNLQAPISNYHALRAEKGEGYKAVLEEVILAMVRHGIVAGTSVVRVKTARTGEAWVSLKEVRADDMLQTYV